MREHRAEGGGGLGRRERRRGEKMTERWRDGGVGANAV